MCIIGPFFHFEMRLPEGTSNDKVLPFKFLLAI